MKRSKKSRKVSWPPEDILCQVRMFASDDCPLIVGLETQDQLKEKASWILHSNFTDSYELPPGFEGFKHVSQLKGKLSCIPKIDWKTPPRVGLSNTWQVAAGEESEEALTEKQRQLKVLEAIYPRHSAIPSSPSVASDIAESYLDDDKTPIVPIIPIEEDEAANFPPNLEEPTLTKGLMTSGIPSSSQYSSTPIPPTNEKTATGVTPVEADVIAAASAAHAVLMKSKEDGSMIDTNLLIKILTDPKMVEKLVEGHGCLAGTEKAHIPSSRLETPKPSLCFTETDIRTSLMQVSGKSYSAQLTSIVMPLQGETPAYREAARVPLAKPLAVIAPQSASQPNVVVSSYAYREEALVPLASPTAVMAPVSISQPNLVWSPAYREATPVPLAKPIAVMVPRSTSQPNLVSSLPSQALANAAAATASAPISGSLDPSPTDRALLTRQSTGNVCPLPNSLLAVKPERVVVSPPQSAPVYTPVVKTPILKDTNYFKNLVKQHGGERQENQDQNHCSQQYGRCNRFEDPKLVHLKQTQTKKTVKSEKPCIFYNTSMGCRNGSSCPFQHGLPFQCYSDGGIWEAKRAKRMRLG